MNEQYVYVISNPDWYGYKIGISVKGGLHRAESNQTFVRNKFKLEYQTPTPIWDADIIESFIHNKYKRIGDGGREWRQGDIDEIIKDIKIKYNEYLDKEIDNRKKTIKYATEDIISLESHRINIPVNDVLEREAIVNETAYSETVRDTSIKQPIEPVKPVNSLSYTLSAVAIIGVLLFFAMLINYNKEPETIFTDKRLDYLQRTCTNAECRSQ